MELPMKKVRRVIPDKFNGKFGNTIAGLVDSEKLTVKRATLRNNSVKLSGAAEFLRATENLCIGDQNLASLMPEMPMTEHDTWTRVDGTNDAVGGARMASDSFERTEKKNVERKDERISGLISIKQPILKLYDQLGGFIKR
jgi:hypothetical protein